MFMLSFWPVPENKTVIGNLCGKRLMHKQILFYIYVHITMNNPEEEYKRPTRPNCSPEDTTKGLKYECCLQVSN